MRCLRSYLCERGCPRVMQDHIVILAASLNSNIDFLLSPLRASYMDGTGYSRHVVILTEGGVRDLLRSPRSGGLTLSSSTPLGMSNSDQRVQVSPSSYRKIVCRLTYYLPCCRLI